MREALATFNSNQDGGAFIITSSIAGRIPVSLTRVHTYLFAADEIPRSMFRNDVSLVEFFWGFWLVLTSFI
jgi:hypothetical protein